MSGSTTLLALHRATKSYGAVHALKEATIELRAGEARALLGENGAGKSTVVKVMAGVHRPELGTVVVDGEPVVFHGPQDARDAGIAVIYQEPTLFPDLSVAENVFMGRQPLAKARRIDRRGMHRMVAGLFGRLGVPLAPEQPVRGLSIADQQLVEIAKALSFDARVLIMDEPTAALSGSEVDRLFGVVRTLRDRGAAVMFISHRLEEVFALCDTVTVMRDGAVTHSGDLDELTPDQLVRQMVGRQLGQLFPKEDAEVGEVVLEVDRLTREGHFVDVSFDVRKGEIVALSGLVGAGRSEVARSIFGIDRRDAGEVRVAGTRLRAASPSAAMSAGVALVPEDRRHQGLVMDLSVERNASMTLVDGLTRMGLIRVATDWTARLQTKFHRLSDPVSTLSGGNQQKVVLAKWLATKPRLLIVDEPTQGIDVGTKAEIHGLISQLASEGVAVLMISSELPEVLGMADRVLVMREGRLVAALSREEATEESIMFAATGQMMGAAA
jgi:rhamnose transport system ATP-binding protein